MARIRCRFGIFVAVLVLTIWALSQFTSAPGQVETNRRVDPRTGDVALYREVAQRVGRGEDYYAAVAAVHRRRSYSLQPVYAVRPPTLAWIASVLPGTALLVLAWFLLAGSMAVWAWRLRSYSGGEKVASLLILGITGAPMISANSVQMHEYWCGVLLTIALAIAERRYRVWQIVVVALAFAVREFAAAFLAVIFLGALVERDRRATVAVVVLAVAATALLTMHWEMVRSVTFDGDGESQGWFGLGGPRAFVRSLSAFSWLSVFPQWIAAVLAFLPILGWSALREDALVAVCWFVGFGLVIGRWRDRTTITGSSSCCRPT